MAGHARDEKMLDGWEVVRIIGEGGYGSVYEVRKELAPGHGSEAP